MCCSTAATGTSTKGTEPEAIEHGRFDGRDYVFVASERGSFVAIYELKWFGPPKLAQVLPAPLGPEGVLAIPGRDLLVVSGEEDDPTFGVRSSMMIYQLKRGGPAYPQIVSDNGDDGLPIPWAALSGMDAVPGHHERIVAVWDSFFAESRILEIDVSRRPAVIRDSVAIQGGTGNYDPEGIAYAPDGTYWIASEGNADGSRPNRLLQVNESGTVLDEVGLPPEIEACRAASEDTSTLGSGFEGVAVQGQNPASYNLLVAQQRGWNYTTEECEDLDDDASGLNALGQPNLTRIWIYDPWDGSWDHVAWELAPLPENAAWVGLSEISKGPRDNYVLIERDNRTGDWADLKTLVRARGRDARDGLIDTSEKTVHDLIPDLEGTRGWITDKPEGVAITSSGDVYVVTDNDGVDDWSGETWFLRLGGFFRLFDSGR